MKNIGLYWMSAAVIWGWSLIGWWIWNLAHLAIFNKANTRPAMAIIWDWIRPNSAGNQIPESLFIAESEKSEKENWLPHWGCELALALRGWDGIQRLETKLQHFKDKIATTPAKKAAIETLLQKIQEKDKNWLQKNLGMIVGLLAWACIACFAVSMSIFASEPRL